MNLPFNTYLLFAFLKLKEEKQFKIDFILSFFAIVINSVILLMLFKNIFFNSEEVSFKYVTEYYVIVNIIFYSVASAMTVAYNIMEDINSGNIIPQLLQPVNYILKIYMEAFGVFFVRLCVHIIFIAAVQIFLLQTFNIISIIAGVISTIIGFSILFFIQTTIGCFTIRFTDITRFRDCIYSLLLILGGKFFPVEYLYGRLKYIVRYTPLPYIFDTPARCFLGKMNLLELQVQCIWFAIFSVILTLFFNLKVKHNIELSS